jgi:predicted transglutaminase-like cysteine proteinase
MARDIAGNQRCAATLCFKSTDLFVKGTNLGALCIIQNRQVDGTGHMVLGKF